MHTARSRGFLAAICSSTALVRTLPTTAAEGMAAPQSTPLSTSASRAASVTAASVGSVSPPLFAFGLIADIQYADLDDAWNFAKTDLRGYRGALACAANAVSDWNGTAAATTAATNAAAAATSASAADASTSTSTITSTSASLTSTAASTTLATPISFVLNLGDIIDQQNESRGTSEKAIESVLRALAPVGVDVHHLVGNHEMYNFSRRRLMELLGLPRRLYTSFVPHPEWRFVNLNSYDITTIDNVETVASTETAYAFLEKKNPNELRGRGTTNWLAGLSGTDRRFVPYNGAIGAEQLEWFRAELRAAKEANQRVVVSSHVPLKPGSCVDTTLLWNYEEVLDIICTEGRGCVVCVFQGHDHSGGYVVDAEGVHFVTMPSPLNAPKEDQRAHARVDVHEDRLVIHGRGIVPSRALCIARADPIDTAAASLSVLSYTAPGAAKL